ncbi:MAG: hypothetical protein C5B47_07955 [Verrucomicrobia bacterium]|nr:MAG: hypothetical protein C5B47_07955 [Verrucomicrobiota bacterium]
MVTDTISKVTHRACGRTLQGSLTAARTVNNFAATKKDAVKAVNNFPIIDNKIVGSKAPKEETPSGCNASRFSTVIGDSSHEDFE